MNKVVIKAKKGNIFMGKNVLCTIKEKLPRCRIISLLSIKSKISPKAQNGLAPVLGIFMVHQTK